MENLRKYLFKTIRQPIGMAALCLVVIATIGIILLYGNRTSQYDSTRGWIETSSVSQGNRFYVVTNEKCTPGKPIGILHNLPPNLTSTQQAQDTAPPPSSTVQMLFANVLPQGTEVFQIDGVDPQKEFCVALDYGNGGYVEALYVGDKAPH